MDADAATLAALRRILSDLDEYGTPRERLPDCPRCREDELGVLRPGLVRCYRCGWELEWPPG